MTRAGIAALFEKHGIMTTPQRVEIASILLERPQHLSADQIIEKLRDGGGSVSKATVYNTLNLFSRRGVVHEVAVDPTHMMYDSTVHPHHHFFNTDTGELTDIDTPKLRITGLPELPKGMTRESVELIVRIRSSR